jgi:hypothetical protein
MFKTVKWISKLASLWKKRMKSRCWVKEKRFMFAWPIRNDGLVFHADLQSSIVISSE